LPAVIWKLFNLKKKEKVKHRAAIDKLEKILY
jgi:hypothetical protein